MILNSRLKKILVIIAPSILIINLSMVFLFVSPYFFINSTQTNPEYFSGQQKEIAIENVKALDSFYARIASVSNYILNYMQEILLNPPSFNKPSYFHNFSVGGTPPNFIYSEKHGQFASFDVSAYKVAPSAYNDPVAFNNSGEDVTYKDWNPAIDSWINLTSALDLAFIPMYASMSEILWTYIGFENGVHRTYPFHSLPKSYDPRVRPWYVDTFDLPQGEVAFSTPFIDASTKKVIITASQAIFNSSGIRIGVIGIDFDLITIQNEVLTGTNESSSHQFLITTDSFILSHPKFKLPDSSWSQTDLEQSIVNNNYETNSSEFSALIASAQLMNQPVQEKIDYGSQGEQLVTLMKLNSTSLIFGIVIDYSSISSKIFVEQIPFTFIFILIIADIVIGIFIYYNKKIELFFRSLLENESSNSLVSNVKNKYSSFKLNKKSRRYDLLQRQMVRSSFIKKPRSKLTINEQKAYLFGIPHIISQTYQFIIDQTDSIFNKRSSLFVSEVVKELTKSIKHNLGDFITNLNNQGVELVNIDYEVLLNFCLEFSKSLEQHLTTEFDSETIFTHDNLKQAVDGWKLND
ncbi:MAG: PDC sensor domain-containing protein [Candidatus Thorarchaeota archaeon]